MVDFLIQNIVQRGQTCFLFEGVAEVIVGITGQFGEVFQLDVERVMFVDVAQDGGKAALRKGRFSLAQQADQELTGQEGTHKVEIFLFVQRFVLNLFQESQNGFIVVAEQSLEGMSGIGFGRGKSQTEHFDFAQMRFVVYAAARIDQKVAGKALIAFAVHFRKGIAVAKIGEFIAIVIVRFYDGIFIMIITI